MIRCAIDTGGGSRTTRALTSSRVNQRASASSPSRRLQLRPGRPRRVAEHQRRRERPRLGSRVRHVGDRQPDLLVDLAGHRRLGRLARLDEPGQDREPPLRPHRLPPQHAPVPAVVHEHDHRRVRTREVLGAVGRAAPHPATVHQCRRRAVDRAARVPVVPACQRDRGREQPGVPVVQRRADLAQVDPAVDRPGPAARAPRTPGRPRPARGNTARPRPAPTSTAAAPAPPRPPARPPPSCTPASPPAPARAPTPPPASPRPYAARPRGRARPGTAPGSARAPPQAVSTGPSVASGSRISAASPSTTASIPAGAR